MSRGEHPDAPTISVVVPLFNERETIAELHRRIAEVLDELDVPAEIVLVDDGSSDATPHLLDTLADADPRVRPVHLTRNFGHQAAVSAGIDLARGEAVIVLDGDLQDPPELIPDLLRLWKEGNDVVFAVRRRRRGSFLKLLAYKIFYRILGAVSDLPIPLDSGDFGLMDRRVVDALKRLPERVRFVRGLRAFVGFRQVGLEYDRPDRLAGEPKYTVSKLFALAADGLVSFSARPLRLVTALGLASAAVALGLTAWVLADALATRTAPRGWASTLVVVLFMGSVQLLSLGIIGEYIRLIFLEAKGRPTYLIREPELEDEREVVPSLSEGRRRGRPS